MFDVLIVEDDPMVAMINEQYVNRNERFRVVATCNNGKTAVEFLSKKSVDLIIMDVFMPNMNGIETLREIRNRNTTASVIMVTAANDTATFEEARKLGAVDYLVKPFDFDRFQQALDKFALAQSLLREGKTLTQSSIDQIVGTSANAVNQSPKGIQEKTKDVILECLATEEDWMTGEKIAEDTGLSSVTVRRYMNYLVQMGDAVGTMNYETGGRPCMLYKIKN